MDMERMREGLGQEVPDREETITEEEMAQIMKKIKNKDVQF